MDNSIFADRPIASALTRLRTELGPSVIASKSVLNALCDYKAFSHNKALCNIFRTIYTQGIYTEILNEPDSTNWSNYVQRYTSNLSINFGFKQELIEELLWEIIWGLGKYYIDNGITEATHKEPIIENASQELPVSTNNSPNIVANFLGIKIGQPYKSFKGCLAKIKRLISSGENSCYYENAPDELMWFRRETRIPKRIGYKMIRAGHHFESVYADAFQSELAILTTPISQIVYEVRVRIFKNLNFSSENTYQIIKDAFIKKYGQPSLDDIGQPTLTLLGAGILKGRKCTFQLSQEFAIEIFFDMCYGYDTPKWFLCISYHSKRLRKKARREILSSFNDGKNIKGQGGKPLNINGI